MSSNISDLSFSGNNPGAAKFGNFINYYTFHSVKERINNLDTKMFQSTNSEDVHCLDIGCNTGELTEELYTYLRTLHPNSTIKMLAIDIDPILIKRAQEQSVNKSITYITCDITSESGCELIKQYLLQEKKDIFDIIFAFSVTMWIHINNGDIGLRKLLQFFKENSKLIVIEPQPWKCYKNAQRRMKRSGKEFELFETLSIRHNVDTVIEEILNENKHIKVYESHSSSWNRKIICYDLRQNL